jgi:alpha-D-xyloside xylohydrolase
LYLRWLAFGALTSHTRCHGTSPKEPWEYGQAVMDQFRRIVELKYRLMPYIYAQAKDSADRGLPMTRALFVEFPEDPGSWSIDDEYLLGSDILAAPLLEENARARNVYLPPGNWIDYQTGKSYSRGWQRIEAGAIPIIMLVREGSVLPHIALAQSTQQMDWGKMDLTVYAKNATEAEGLICLPSDNRLIEIKLAKKDRAFRLTQNPLDGKVAFKVQETAAGI